MTTATFTTHPTQTVTGAFPAIDSDRLLTAAAVIAAIVASSFVLSILATVQAGF
ncbi:MAG: hypothetical protein WDN04_02060 [Rhodospirillales bacterium]